MWWQNVAKCCKIEMEMHLLQTENQMLKRENLIRSNEIKTLKVIQSSKTEIKESTGAPKQTLSSKQGSRWQNKRAK